jgi:hypothetical protein
MLVIIQFHYKMHGPYDIKCGFKYFDFILIHKCVDINTQKTVIRYKVNEEFD